MRLEKAIEDYAKYAIKHGEATELGESVKANRAHNNLYKALGKIASTGEIGKVAFVKLLSHSNPSVVMWAGTHSLGIAPKEAKAALNQVKEKGGISAFSSSMVLEEWEKGNIDDPFVGRERVL
ncbi:MAG: DUF2019 domain-containing protein [Pseudomonadales bacterium]|nr:DUF2019 domain-containing protein [Pseudomonadales bacterium]